jgi:hypothetical protein
MGSHRLFKLFYGIPHVVEIILWDPQVVEIILRVCVCVSYGGGERGAQGVGGKT